jgi:predicted ATPase
VDASRLVEVKVPPTLTGVLQARLDGPDAVWEKTVLQRASVIGREFWDGAVEQFSRAGSTTSNKNATVSDPGGPRSRARASRRYSNRSGAKSLIYRREASAFAGAREYIFKHALLRDVTYESVLKRDRRAYHRRAAEWLARRSGGRVGEYAGLIAEHYDRAQSAEDAAEWYGRAGRQARASLRARVRDRLLPQGARLHHASSSVARIRTRSRFRPYAWSGTRAWAKSSRAGALRRGD